MGDVDSMTWVAWVAVGGSIAAIAALIVVIAIWRKLNRPSSSRLDTAMPDPMALAAIIADDGEPKRATFIYNPTKERIDELRSAAGPICAAFGWAEPTWLQTTSEDPGVGQAMKARKDGADLVLACGGDGTVRAVAEGLAGSEVPMGLVPLGTANLLARNLDLPMSNIEEAIAVALSGHNRRIDVGWVDLLNDADKVMESHNFLVIGGLGFDAMMVGDADPKLKRKLGWVAYFFAGIRHLHDSRMRVRLQLDDEEPIVRRARSVLFGNCGRLPAGMVLIPDAEIDDGLLDIVAIDPRGGVFGWTVLTAEVARQGVQGLKNTATTINHVQGKRIRVRSDDREAVQVDGDIVGRTRSVQARIDPGALLVRVTSSTGA